MLLHNTKHSDKVTSPVLHEQRKMSVSLIARRIDVELRTGVEWSS
jgi:hypothetical protein